ncbi:hypothetical protein NDU88_004974 [Pleurodeles waltl]|uniref:Uncharacterized protein n=1 Tax=Pleurodeles waltl TaxID=8319 RepID=A0AAV7NL03_PLEWA|nr:hypothetical protein NDU88_004974 [Pleurodeles waltl]
MFVRSLKLPVRLGAYGMQGCLRGSSPSPPAVLGSLRTCAQGAAAAIAGLLGSSLGAHLRLVTVGPPGEPLRRFGQVSRVSGCY